MKKIRFLIASSMIIAGFSSCNHASDIDYPFVFTGTIEEAGITTYMYGTHVISDSEKYYAIKSDNIDLDHFVHKEVTIGGEIISGYPLNIGEPVYVNVLEVR